MVHELKSDSDSPAVTSSPLPKMTYEEFLDWYDESRHAEWVDGEVILMGPVSKRHQLLVSFLGALIQLWTEDRKLGLSLIAPFQMKLSLRPSGREPDVLFIASERLRLLQNNYLDGGADLAIEVISPDSRTRDRRDKYQEYEQAGVREYWIIDPIRQQAQFYRLNSAGAFCQIAVGDDGIYHSDVLEGLWLEVDWLWQEPLPPLMSVLREWGLVK
jgi:Uma2 family endonuclease